MTSIDDGTWRPSAWVLIAMAVLAGPASATRGFAQLTFIDDAGESTPITDKMWSERWIRMLQSIQVPHPAEQPAASPATNQ